MQDKLMARPSARLVSPRRCGQPLRGVQGELLEKRRERRLGRVCLSHLFPPEMKGALWGTEVCRQRGRGLRSIGDELNPE